jgi:hypothetical protein
MRWTNFEFDGRVYEWNSMVMGFKNAPQILQRVMTKILHEFRNKGVEIYMDDIVVHAKTKDAHNKLVRGVFEKLRVNRMRVNTKKNRKMK